MLPQIIFFLAVYSILPLAIAFDISPSPSRQDASVRPLYLFPNGTAAENLLVRRDGSVLLTMLDPSAALYYFPPARYSDPVLLYNFTGSAAAYGIAEYAPDQFAVCTGTFDRSGNVTNATGIIWKVDMTDFKVSDSGIVTSPANVTRHVNMTDIGFLNGAATLTRDSILVADSVKGVVYFVDMQDRKYSVVLNDTTMAPNTTGAVRLGVNGLRVVNRTLYYTNTNQRLVGKVDLYPNATAASPYTTIASNVLVDDLEVDPSTGAIYLPSFVANEITFVAPNGTASVLAGSLNSTDIPGPTSLRFARYSGNTTKAPLKLLISSSGGIEYPINGTYIQGGGLYELDIFKLP